MDRLAKVTDEILRSAKEKANGITAEADKAAAEIAKGAKSESDAMRAQHEKRLKDAFEHTDMISGSDMRQYKRTELLKIKSAMVEKAVDAARENIEKKPTEEYFALMQRIAEKYCPEESGELRLNERDRKRVTREFEDYCKKRGFVISKKTADISAGFEIHNGRVVTDCSVEGLFSDCASVLSDAAKKAFE